MVEVNGGIGISPALFKEIVGIMKIIAWIIILSAALTGAAHAEVMDKEPSLGLILVLGIVGASLCFLTARFLPWLLLLMAPIPFALLSEIRDPYIGPAIFREAGFSYVASAYGLALAMVLFAFAGLCLRRWSKQHNKPIKPADHQFP